MREQQHQWRRWYGLQRWRNIARHQLRTHPCCEYCLREGIVGPATVADHVTPHHGDPTLFWFGKLQSLCHAHHVSDKATIEQRGYSTAIGHDGLPIDRNHPYYQS
jgi:5-methylcytosine-specific restriction enzyme A